MNKIDYKEYLPLGIVQTTIDDDLAWNKLEKYPHISEIQDAHVWNELCTAIKAFNNNAETPKIIIFPELTLPRTRLNDFGKLIARINAIAVIGVDYLVDMNQHVVKNEGLIFIPNNYFFNKPSRYCSTVKLGKTTAAPGEEKRLNEFVPQFRFIGDQNVYLINCDEYGCFGLSICYDFMDIERALMYRDKILHLFIIAYNKDINMFKNLANSLSRVTYCNVVVCNTGKWGGSLVVSPYSNSSNRTLYEHNGGKLFTTQTVKLPVKSLWEAQNGNLGDGDTKFKDPPPNSESAYRLYQKRENLK